MSEKSHESGSYEHMPLLPEYAGARVDTLILASPDAVRLTIEQESASTIPAYDRDVDNKLLCETIWYELAEQYGDDDTEAANRQSFMTGIRWAYALACRTGMEQPPRLRDGIGPNPELTNNMRAHMVLGEALTYGLNSDVAKETVNEFCKQLHPKDKPDDMVRHGMLIGLYLVDRGEFDKDASTREQDNGEQSEALEPLPHGRRLTAEEQVTFNALVLNYYRIDTTPPPHDFE